MTSTTFRIHPTPVGDVLLLASPAGLIGLDVLDAPLGIALEGWTRLLGAVPEPGDDAGAAENAAEQLEEYFDGSRTAFTVPIDWSPVRGFTRAALQAVGQIPYAQTGSYGDVAHLAGSPRAHRAVGSACAHAPISIIVPVHRVVRSDGSIGEYGGRPDLKRALLDHEAAHRPAGV